MVVHGIRMEGLLRFIRLILMFKRIRQDPSPATTWCVIREATQLGLSGDSLQLTGKVLYSRTTKKRSKNSYPVETLPIKPFVAACWRQVPDIMRLNSCEITKLIPPENRLPI